MTCLWTFIILVPCWSVCIFGLINPQNSVTSCFSCLNASKIVLIISCCIVERCLGYGVLLLDCLALLGFYPRGLLIYWQIGEIGLENTLQIFGIWYHIVLCGLFGGSSIISYFKIWCFLGTSYYGTLFDWSRAWGFTSRESIPHFLMNFFFVIYISYLSKKIVF